MKAKVVKMAKKPKRPTCKRIGKATLLKTLSARLDELVQKYTDNQNSLDIIVQAQREIYGAMNELSTLIMEIEFNQIKSS